MEIIETLRQVPLLADALMLLGIGIVAMSMLRGLGLRPHTRSRR